MAEASRQPKDKNYNLITVLYQSSENAETLKSYVEDAEQEGDQELAEFFNGVLENNLEANQRAKEMLVPRLQEEEVGAHQEEASAGPLSTATDTVGGVTDTVGGVTEPVRGVTDKLLGGRENKR